MRVSKLITKIIIRIFFILLLAVAFLFFSGDQAKYQHIYFSFTHKWQMVFPAIIVLSFLVLFVACARKRYNEPEMNWLLVVNTVVLLAYGIAVFIKVSSLVH